MDWTTIITAAVTGAFAVIGQWVISRRKSKEDEARDVEREKNQNERLKNLEVKIESVESKVEQACKTLNTQESALLIQQENMTHIRKELDDNNLRTLRLDLLHAIETDPDNQLVILDMAKKYFFDMKGNCYMSKVFQEWADEHNVNITSIFNKG